MNNTCCAGADVSFDIAFDGALCNGRLCLLPNGILSVYIEEEKITEYELKSFAELKQTSDFGAGALELVPADEGSEPTEVCRFTMGCATEMAELCKAVNFYLKQGELHTDLNLKRRRCPHCGRPLRQNTATCLFCIDKSAVIKRAAQTAKPYFGKILLAGGFGIAASILNSLYPILYGWFTDGVVGNGNALFAEPIRGVWTVVALMFGAKALAEGAAMLSRRISARVSAGYANTLRCLVYDSIQQLSVASLSRRPSGDLMKRVTNDTNRLQEFFTDQGRYMVEQIFTLTFVLTVLFVTDWRLTLLVLLPVPLVLCMTRFFWGYMHVRYEKQWRAESRCGSILHDIIKGIRVVKTFGAESREISKFSDANRRLAGISESNERHWALMFQPMEFLVGAGEFLVLLVGGRMVLNGTLPLGHFIRFVMFLGYIYGPLRWFSHFPRWLASAMTSMVKIFEIIDEKPEIFNVNDALQPKLTGEIAFEHVNFGYKSYVPVLKDISFEIKPGEMIGLVGPSGVGKSTVINLVMRLYDPNSGVIRFDGYDHRELDRKVLHEQMGAVFQETFLFAGTVYENIAYGLPQATPEQVIGAAKAANAHDFIMKLPDGYNTMLGEDGHNLSGGERQRVSIARAILKDPKILILDEATSALDPETEEQIQQALENLTKNRTTIAIAHRLATLRHATRLFVFEKGKVAEIGTHDELLRQKGMYYRLVMAQRQTADIKHREGKKPE